MNKRYWMILSLIAGMVLVYMALRRPAEPQAVKRFRHSFLVMGTQATVLIDWPVALTRRFNELMTGVEEKVRRAEKLMSRFDPDSDISRFNAAPAGEWVAINPLTWKALTVAAQAHELSSGAFDITILPLLSLYDWKNTAAERFPADREIAAARQRTGMEKIVWQREGMRIRKTIAGLQIDLGGVAKGLGVDIAADYLRDHGVTDAVVDIGGEQRLLGRAARQPESVKQNLGAKNPDTQNAPQLSGDTASSAGRAWVAAIRSPRGRENADTPALAQILRINRDCAIATSGDYEQYFTWKGKRYSHIIDPRSGRPLCGGTVSATIVLPGDCVTADALATAASVLKVEETRRMLRFFPTAAAWLILENGETVHIPAITGNVVNE